METHTPRPNEATGFMDSATWKTLYQFQKDAALIIINKLETYNGCILADSVDLGKTFTALAVIKYYENRNRAVLVLCPKRLGVKFPLSTRLEPTYQFQCSDGIIIPSCKGVDLSG